MLIKLLQIASLAIGIFLKLHSLWQRRQQPYAY